MYALMTTLTIKPGKRDEAVAVVDTPGWQEAIALLKQIPGFKSSYALLTAGTEKDLYTAFHLFETEAQARAAVDSPQTKEMWRVMEEAGMLAYVERDSVARTFYEVLAQV